MIVVIADDLSGAAELAGVALGYGLSAEVQTRFHPEAASRVVCLDMEGRARPAVTAAAETEATWRSVSAVQPEWIFFKFDSVLRGNIAAQLEAALAVSGLARSILITANPSRGRTIRGGEYFIDRVPLHLTSFAHDPLFPCFTPDVRRLLGSDDPRIMTPDIETTRDLEQWARKADETALLAGSAEFFESLLRHRVPEYVHRQDAGYMTHVSDEMPTRPSASTAPALLVCGSPASWRTRVAEAEARGIAVFDLLDDPRRAAATLIQDGALLLGIGDRMSPGSASPAVLLDRLGDMVAAVCARARLSRLLLEGGATAAAVMERMGWSRLICEESIGSGIATLRLPAPGAGLLLLIKPGSYPWPAEAW